jgi:hypothetical protein
MNTPPKWGKNLKQVYKWNRTGVVEENVDVCILSFVIPEDIKPPILLYYRLTNFYQNHRRYVKSLDIEQLKGNAQTASQIKGGECDPLEVDDRNRPYYPCGLIANSMFNDTFEDLTAVGGNGEGNVYPMTEEGISWSTEKDLYGITKYKNDQIAVPPNWKNQYPQDGYDTVGPPNLKEWEAFQVWMRTAGLPTFSKLAKRNDKLTLKAGTYNLKIFSRAYLPYSRPICVLTQSRIRCRAVRWDQIDPDLHPHRHGWQEPLPRHRLHCRGWPLHPAWCRLHRHPSYQAQVGDAVIN